MTGWRRTTGVVCALWVFSDLSWLAVESTAVWSAGRIGDKGGVVQTCGAAGGIGTLVWQHDEWWLKAIGINRILLCLKVAGTMGVAGAGGVAAWWLAWTTESGLDASFTNLQILYGSSGPSGEALWFHQTFKHPVALSTGGLGGFEAGRIIAEGGSNSPSFCRCASPVIKKVLG